MPDITSTAFVKLIVGHCTWGGSLANRHAVCPTISLKKKTTDDKHAVLYIAV